MIEVVRAWAVLNRFDRAIIARKWPDLASALEVAESLAGEQLEIEVDE